MNLEEIEVILDNALARQCAKGVTIVRGEYGIEVGAYSDKVEFENRHGNPCACAFGAWAIDKQIESSVTNINDLLRAEARKAFGITENEFTAFLNGYDDGDTDYADPRVRALAEMGKRLSEKYVGPFDTSAAI